MATGRNPRRDKLSRRRAFARRQRGPRRRALRIETLEDRRLLFAPDAFEANESLASAADLGVIPGTHLQSLTIDDAADQDWYQVELLRADDLDVEIGFDSVVGSLQLE